MASDKEMDSLKERAKAEIAAHARRVRNHRLLSAVLALLLLGSLIYLHAGLEKSRERYSYLYRDFLNVSEEAREASEEVEKLSGDLDGAREMIENQKSLITRQKRNLRSLCATFVDEKPVQCRPAKKKPEFKISNPITKQ